MKLRKNNIWFHILFKPSWQHPESAVVRQICGILSIFRTGSGFLSNPGTLRLPCIIQAMIPDNERSICSQNWGREKGCSVLYYSTLIQGRITVWSIRHWKFLGEKIWLISCGFNTAERWLKNQILCKGFNLPSSLTVDSAFYRWYSIAAENHRGSPSLLWPVPVLHAPEGIDSGLEYIALSSGAVDIRAAFRYALHLP